MIIGILLFYVQTELSSSDIKGEWEEFMHDEMSEVVEWLEAMSWDNLCGRICGKR